MREKYAIGLTVNGNEVRAAFMTLIRGKACIVALESTKLETPLEEHEKATIGKKESLNDLEKAFNIDESSDTVSQEFSSTGSEKSASNNNVSLIYALVDRFQNLKASVAINTPVLNVKYSVLDAAAVPKEKTLRTRFKESIDIWSKDNNEEGRSSRLIDIDNDKALQIDYDYHPPIIDVLEEVNQFRSGKMSLVLMDTNELSLVDLVGEIYKFKKKEVTAIIYIEEDFSRIIFLKGRNVYHITPIIHKGSMSDDVLEVIYSRILFAQDHHFIPELNKILVAGHSSKLKAKYYFRQKFPSAVTGYLNSRKIPSRLKFKDRGLLFSRYAIPIALAWKGLQKGSASSNRNLLPEYLVEKQKMPKLAMHGYLLLMLVGVTAFAFTWLLVVKNIEIRKVNRAARQIEQQIESNQSLSNRVRSFDDQIVDMETKFELVNNFSKGYTQTAEFLKTLNEKLKETGDIWLTDLRKESDMVAITGVSVRRDKIPLLAGKLGNASLKKVTRSSLHDSRVFTFKLEKQLSDTDEADNQEMLSLFTSNSDNRASSQGDQAEVSQNPGNGSPATNGKAHADHAGGENGNSQDDNSQATQVTETENPYVYGLRIGSYTSRDQAAKESRKYAAKGYPVVVSRDNTRYSVVVGAYQSKQQAQKLSVSFADRWGIDNTLVRYKNTD